MGGFVVFSIPLDFLLDDLPARKRRGKGEEPLKAYNMSKRYKSIVHAITKDPISFWIILSIISKMPWTHI